METTKNTELTSNGTTGKMGYGKLGVRKTYGEKPTFVLFDEHGIPKDISFDLTEWLAPRLGHRIDVLIVGNIFRIYDEGDE